MAKPINGSSPRAWGKSRIRWFSVLLIAVHPHVRGANAALTGPAERGEVHPHVRGANVHQHAAGGVQYGSSPRAWGKCCKVIAV